MMNKSIVELAVWAAIIVAVALLGRWDRDVGSA